MPLEFGSNEGGHRVCAVAALVSSLQIAKHGMAEAWNAPCRAAPTSHDSLLPHFHGSAGDGFPSLAATERLTDADRGDVPYPAVVAAGRSTRSTASARLATVNGFCRKIVASFSRSVGTLLRA